MLAKLFLLSFVGIVFALDDIASVSRDGYGRADPNSLLNGFFPAWPIILLCLAGVFLVVAGVSFLLYMLGCRGPKDEFRKVPIS